MTAVDARPASDALEEELLAGERWAAPDDIGEPPVPEPAEGSSPRPPLDVRALVATALTTSSAALVVGGIFDSWACRLLGIVAVSLGSAGVALVLRSRRQLFSQVLTLLAIGLGATLTLTGSAGGPSNLTAAVRHAVNAGRLLQPPVPFDPGWRPLVFGLMAGLAFGAGWLATAGQRRLAGALLPLPLPLLASFTQPHGQEILTAAFIFLPVIGAMATIFTATQPGQQTDVRFEVRRASRAALLAVPAVGLLLVLNNANFLFPKPTYDPNDKPQKPRSIPPSSRTDRVLFTVEAPDGFTGPWRTGVLDVYQDGAFLLPPRAANRLQPVPASGVVDATGARSSSVHVRITTADLGDSPILPGVPSQAKVLFPPSAPSDIRIDSRTGVIRVESGRAPAGLSYEIDLPPYPAAEQLKDTRPAGGSGLQDDLVVPHDTPPAVQRILRAAPPSGWDRLDFVRHQLLDNVTAAGPGNQVPIDASRVQDILDGSKKASPFEIVATEVLLARWAGFPARIGFGFNEFHTDNGQRAVHPDNAAQWLEVDFAGRGWLPFLAKPPRADSTLDANKDTDKDVVASNEIAVQLFLPVGLPRPVPLFELIRARILQALPLLLLLLAARATAPAVWRLARRRHRERWAEERGPRGRIAVAYAEWRDLATDLNVGDPFATPLEYLDRVEHDEDHEELAWLVSRTMYGDRATVASAEDAAVAEELSTSLQARLRAGQPTQVRLLALITQASMRAPYTREVPNMQLPAPGRWVASRWQAIRRELARRRRTRRLAREVAVRRRSVRIGATR